MLTGAGCPDRDTDIVVQQIGNPNSGPRQNSKVGQAVLPFQEFGAKNNDMLRLVGVPVDLALKLQSERTSALMFSCRPRGRGEELIRRG